MSYARASFGSHSKALLTAFAGELVFLGIALILLVVLVRDRVNVSDPSSAGTCTCDEPTWVRVAGGDVTSCRG